jgi:hypothetical protein
MNDVLEKRVRVTAVAGWWLVLIAAAFVVLQWLVYLTVIDPRSAWVFSVWGPNVDRAFLQMVWLWAIPILKFIVWLVLIVLWATLWTRQIPEANRRNVSTYARRNR